MHTAYLHQLTSTDINFVIKQINVMLATQPDYSSHFSINTQACTCTYANKLSTSCVYTMLYCFLDILDYRIRLFKCLTLI